MRKKKERNPKRGREGHKKEPDFNSGSNMCL